MLQMDKNNDPVHLGAEPATDPGAELATVPDINGASSDQGGPPSPPVVAETLPHTPVAPAESESIPAPPLTTTPTATIAPAEPTTPPVAPAAPAAPAPAPAPTAETHTPATEPDAQPHPNPKVAALQAQVARLTHELGDADADAIVQRHIRLLHTYNEIKDGAQALIGRYALLTNSTVTGVHRELGLSLHE